MGASLDAWRQALVQLSHPTPPVPGTANYKKTVILARKIMKAKMKSHVLFGG